MRSAVLSCSLFVAAAAAAPALVTTSGPTITAGTPTPGPAADIYATGNALHHATHDPADVVSGGDSDSGSGHGSRGSNNGSGDNGVNLEFVKQQLGVDPDDGQGSGQDGMRKEHKGGNRNAAMAGGGLRRRTGGNAYSGATAPASGGGVVVTGSDRARGGRLAQLVESDFNH